ncbi:MAG: TlpA family protein disulfide reductase [Rhizobiaceae bacterium]|nr:TlpA family protein disulfide reductase [Rhizobiaceae bacterium]
MADKRPGRLFPAWRAVALALAAGVLAGALAVYVSATMSGNTTAAEPAPAADAGAGNAADALCSAKSARARTLADSATGDVAAMLPADPPVSLASLAFNDPDGKPMSIADHAGKTVLLNLWATWCAPCRAEMPALDALQRATGGPGFEVVAVNVDTGDNAKPDKFLEETGVGALARYRDPTLGIFNELKKRGLALGLPVTLLIDAEGCLLAHMNGPAEWAGADAKRLISNAIR